MTRGLITREARFIIIIFLFQGLPFTYKFYDDHSIDGLFDMLYYLWHTILFN